LAQLKSADSVTEAATEFGFKASTPLRDGLRATVDWYLSNREEAEARIL
jgi:nucleoside-diphosphate-sugar epimerase